MADDINVTVTDADALDVEVEGDAQITVEDTEETLQNNVADEANQAITVEGDTTVSVTNSDAKEGYLRETFTNKSGTNQVLLLGNTFRSNSLVVFLNGILMEKDVDYSEGANRDRITVLISLETTDKIECRYVVN